MILDVAVGSDSTTIEISEPFRADVDAIVKRIDRFAASKGADMAGLELKRLISGMIKGIAGCEHGCPANAKGFVSAGFRDFELRYIEGGILLASTSLGGGSPLSLRMFPDF